MALLGGGRKQQPLINPKSRRKHLINALLDATSQQNVALPPGLTPLSPLNGSSGVIEFHMLNDTETGVLALGSFAAGSFDDMQESLLTGLQNLKNKGATRLIVDVVRFSLLRFTTKAHHKVSFLSFADKQWWR